MITVPTDNMRLFWRNATDYLARWHYRVSTKRDPRLDLLRGLCIVILIIDHIAGFSPLYYLTGGSEFYVSAAEGFICISGYLFGSVYRTIVEREGMAVVWRKALRRSGALYLVMLATTLVLFCGGVIAGLDWATPRDLGGFAALMWRIATIHDTFRLTRILLMYSLLIMVAPLGIWLLHTGRVKLLLAISWALYLAYQAAPAIFSQPLPINAYFSPSAYQILFVHMMAIGYHREAVARFFNPARRRALFAACSLGMIVLLALFISSGAVVPRVLTSHPDYWLGKLFYRDLLRPGRLAATMIVLPFFYLTITYLWAPIRKIAGGVLMLGQYSLYCYTMHIPFTILFDWLERQWAGSGPQLALLNTLSQVAVILVIWLMARRRLLFAIFPN